MGFAILALLAAPSAWAQDPTGRQLDGLEGLPGGDGRSIAGIGSSDAASPATAGDGAQEAPVLAWLRPLRIGAMAYGSYAYNVNKPRGRLGATAYRSFDADHNTFVPDLLELSLWKPLEDDGWDAGFRIDLALGRTADLVGAAPWPKDDGVDLLQGYAEAQLPLGLAGPLRLKGGKFVTWIGAEVVESPANINISRSFLFTLLSPFTHTGVSASWELVDGLSYTQFLVNGWDTVIDNNDAKTVGGQVAWTVEDLGLGVFVSWIHGAEQDDSTHDPRTGLDAVVTYEDDLLRAYVELCYGRESFDGADGEWGGIASAVQVTPGDLFVLGLRGEYVRDRNGTRTGSGSTVELRGVTVTAGLRFKTWGMLRVEYRHDWASRAIFPDDRLAGAENDQGTVAVELSFRF